MTLQGMLGQEVMVLRQTPGGVDEQQVPITSDAEGNPVETEAEQGPYAARLEPVNVAEVVAGSVLEESTHFLYLLPDTPIDGSDRVMDENWNLYEVQGPAKAVPNRVGDPHHLVATVRLLEV